MAIMTNKEFVKKLETVAKEYKTLYVMGCFGAPLKGSNVIRYCNNHSYNKSASRQRLIKANANQNPPVFGFDCVNLLKAILWGWSGNASMTYGGAKYASNGVPDINADSMFGKCADQSTNFSKIEVGEALWVKGHIGVYIGNGLAVECTPSWANKVQITAVGNIGKKSGYNTRNWTKHGKLPYIEYIAEPVKEITVDGLKVGDTVIFSGNKHYNTSYPTAVGRSCKAGRAKITAMRLNGAHPYHLVAVSGGGSNVYGWVNAADIDDVEKPYTPAVGDRVKLATNATLYGKTSKFASWVYRCTLFVRSVNGSRVVVSTQKTGAVTGAVDKKYLSKV